MAIGTMIGMGGNGGYQPDQMGISRPQYGMAGPMAPQAGFQSGTVSSPQFGGGNPMSSYADGKAMAAPGMYVSHPMGSPGVDPGMSVGGNMAPSGMSAGGNPMAPQGQFGGGNPMAPQGQFAGGGNPMGQPGGMMMTAGGNMSPQSPMGGNSAMPMIQRPMGGPMRSFGGMGFGGQPSLMNMFMGNRGYGF